MFDLAAKSPPPRSGTWGQVALGVAGQLPGSGWVWYARGDYRFGENIEGWSANAGIRYHYVPEPIVASKMPTKGPAVPVVTAVNWTGFYIGVSAGGVFTEYDVTYPGLAATKAPGSMACWQAASSATTGRPSAAGGCSVLEIVGNWTNARGGKVVMRRWLACPRTGHALRVYLRW